MITYNEAPQGSLGGVNTSKNLSGYTFPIQTPGIRSLSGGTLMDNLAVGNSYGTLFGTLDPVTGIWTCPVTGYYDLSLLFSLSVDVSPFNNLSSGANPNGFIGPSPNPVDVPDFNHYTREIIVGITDTAPTAGLIYCANSQLIYIDTSHVVISAAYNGRRITAGSQLQLRALSKCPNEIIGQAGNSFHFSISHLK